jgi:hypothetical protein
VLLPGEEVEHHVAVGEVADLAPVGRRQSADDRRQRGRTGPPLRLRQRLIAADHRAERLRPALPLEELPRHRDDLQRVGLALLAGVAPGGDAVAAENDTDRVRVVPLDLGDVQA